MARRAVVIIGLLAVGSGLLIGVPGRAQVSSASQGCPSSPVANAKLPDRPFRRVIVERIEFDRPIHLSSSDVAQIVEKANGSEWDAGSSAWMEQLAFELRSAWQDRGYFRMTLDDPHAQSLGGDSNGERFLVTVHVINEGFQYHLGDIRFTGNTDIAETELRQSFPLREGELFDVSRVREGVEALKKLYGSNGYLDFTATPETEVDDNLQRISVVMRLDAQKQFRVGSVEIRGLDPSLEADLRLIAVPGETFNFEAVTAFFKDNKSILPARGIEHLQVRRNQRTGIVDLTFDPRSCV